MGLSSGFCKNEIWKYLGENTPYNSILELKTTLSKLDRKLKRYDMLPVFARHFCPNNVPKKKPSSSQVRTALLLFNRLERRWKQVNTKRFFSYMFLIEKILEKIGLADYVPLSKQLVCVRRRKYYTEWLHKLGGLSTRWRLEREEQAEALKFAYLHLNRDMQVNSHQLGNLPPFDIAPRAFCEPVLQCEEPCRANMQNTNALHAARASAKLSQLPRAHEEDHGWNRNLRALLRFAQNIAS